VAVVKYE